MKLPILPDELDASIKSFSDLPLNPDLLPRLQTLLTNENSILIDIATLLKADPSITTRLVKLSNSSFFNPEQPVSTLEEAISRIGFKEVNNLVNLEISKRLLGQPLAPYHLQANELWHLSLATAYLMEALAPKFGFPKDIAYTIGLLAQVGKVFISKLASNAYKESPFSQSPLDAASEIAFLGFSSSEASEKLLFNWNFPDTITTPIKFQASPYDAPDVASLPSQMLHLALLASTKINTENIEDPALWTDELNYLDSIGRPHSDLFSSIKRAQNSLSDMKDILDALHA